LSTAALKDLDGVKFISAYPQFWKKNENRSNPVPPLCAGSFKGGGAYSATILDVIYITAL